MIYIFCLNPAYDQKIYIEDLKKNDVSKVSNKTIMAGGKGTNVARLINRCSRDYMLVTWKESEKLSVYEELLVKEKINVNYLSNNLGIRTNIMIYDNKTKQEFRLNEIGDELKAQDLENIYNIIDVMTDRDLVILSGSISGLNNYDLYQKMISRLNEKKTKVFLDCDNEFLKYAIKEPVYFLKPNLEEYKRIFGKEISKKRIIEIVQQFQIENMLLTNGRQDAFLYHNNELYKIKFPTVNIRDSLGAGDILLGSIVHFVSSNETILNAVKLGFAMCISILETGNCAKKDDYYDKIFIEKV